MPSDVVPLRPALLSVMVVLSLLLGCDGRTERESGLDSGFDPTGDDDDAANDDDDDVNDDDVGDDDDTTAATKLGPLVHIDGSEAFCGIDADGTLACWGNDIFDQVSDAPTEGVWVDVDCGSRACCGVTDAGEISCWGEQGASAPVDGPGDFTNVVVGANSSGCAAGGPWQEVVCWGSHGTGSTPTPPEGSTAASLDIENVVGCMVEFDGGLTCWGYQSSPLHDTIPSAGSFSRVDVGRWDIACALSSSGTMSCWGGGASVDGLLAGQPSGVFADVAIRDAACAVTADGELVCWRNSDDDGEDWISEAPSGSDYVAVAVGGSAACALSSDGQVECWGSQSNFVPPPGAR